MIQLRRTFPYFGTVFKIAKPYFRTMSAKKYHGMPRMLCQPRSNIFYKCNYFFSSLRSKSRVYKEAEEMYKLYGWSQEYQQLSFDILLRQIPNFLNNGFIDEEETQWFEQFANAARENLQEDDFTLFQILFVLGFGLSGKNLNQRAIKVLQELQAKFHKHPHMKKSRKEVYFVCMEKLGKLLQTQSRFKESLDIFNRFKNSFENFDQDNNYIDDAEKRDFYTNQSLNSLNLRNYKQCIQAMKKAAYFSQKSQKNERVKILTLKSLYSYSNLESKFGDRALGQKSFMKVLQMLNFSEFPEFISCAVQICTDAFECGLQEASASKLKELIQYIDANNLIETCTHTYIEAHHLLSTILICLNKIDESLSVLQNSQQAIKKTDAFMDKELIGALLLIQLSAISLLSSQEDRSYNFLLSAKQEISLAPPPTVWTTNTQFYIYMKHVEDIIESKPRVVQNKFNLLLNELLEMWEQKLVQAGQRDKILKKDA